MIVKELSPNVHRGALTNLPINEAFETTFKEDKVSGWQTAFQNNPTPSHFNLQVDSRKKMIVFYCYFVMTQDGKAMPLRDGDDWKKFSCLPVYETQELANNHRPFQIPCWCDEITLKEVLTFVLDGHVRLIKIIHEKGVAYIDDLQAKQLAEKI